MYPLTATLKAALLTDHTPIARITVLRGLNPLATTLVGQDSVVLLPLSGSVDVSDAQVRRTLGCVLVDPDGTITPASANDLLAPRRYPVLVERGARTTAGDEFVPLGLFQITNSRVFETRAGVKVELRASQYNTRRLQRARFIQPYMPTAGASLGRAIMDMLSSRISGLTFRVSQAITATVPSGIAFAVGDDPWARASDLAAAAGCELFEDPTGVIVVQDIPDITQISPSWSFTDSARTLLDAEKELDDEQAYNHVIVTGESPLGTPVYGTWLDTNPSSPSYVGIPSNGVYPNDVPYFYTSRLISTAAQAAAVAASLGRSVTGITEMTRITGMVNPALERGDVVSFARDRLRTSFATALDTFSIPLAYNTGMPATLRKRSVT